LLNSLSRTTRSSGALALFHLMLKLAVTLWQFFSDDVYENFQAIEGGKKQSLTDLERVCRHGTPQF
jgi:hypothetical protein